MRLDWICDIHKTAGTGVFCCAGCSLITISILRTPCWFVDDICKEYTNQMSVYGGGNL